MAILKLMSRGEPKRRQSGVVMRAFREAVDAIASTARDPDCDCETTPGSARRGPAFTPEAEARGFLRAAWTMWALGSGTFVYATPLETARRKPGPRSATVVQVFASARPSEPCLELARLEMRREGGFAPEVLEAMIERLREKAAELGADALCLEGVTERASSDGAVMRELSDHGTAALFASCFVYDAGAQTSVGVGVQ